MNVQGLDRLIDSLPENGFPVVRVIITKDGETVYTRSAGYADADKTRKPSASDLYRIYSVSKVCTCTAAMQLVEQGKLGLYDDVAKYIPAFGDMKIQDKNGLRPTEHNMKIWQLFSMTGGMDYDLASDGIKRVLAANPKAGTVELVTAMAEKPLFFEPGTRYRYSLCHDVLAAVVEIVSGERFADYCRNHIFDPLGMTETTFHPTAEQEKRICSLYSFHNWDGTSEERKNVNQYVISPNYDSGGAGIVSSPDEYVKLMSALACSGCIPGGNRILKPETVAMMQKNYLVPAAMADFVSWRLYGYGWGLCGRVHVDPKYSMSLAPKGEFGWDGAAGAFVMADPENRIGLYFATHTIGSSYAYREIHPRLRNLVYED